MNFGMNLLCWDTCTSHVSFAIFKQSTCVVHQHWCRKSGDDPARFLVSKLANALISVELGFRDLHGVCATSGPGSFTGIRLGFSMAQGFCQALTKPLATFSVFEVAYGHVPAQDQRQEVWVVVNTYGSFWAIQIYDSHGVPSRDGFVMTPDDLHNTLAESTACTNTLPGLLVGVGVDLDTFGGTLNIPTLTLQDDLFAPCVWMGEQVIKTPQRLLNPGSQSPLYLKQPSVGHGPGSL